MTEKVIPNITRIVIGPLQTNCYILSCPVTSETIIIDAGGDAQQIITYIEQNNLKPSLIVSTHGHIDHTAGVAILKKQFGINFAMHEGDKEILRMSIKEASQWGFGIVEEPTIDFTINQNDIVRFGKFEAEIIHTPGHTPGGISISLKDTAFVGDTLFASSIGRTDFLGGNFEELISSINNKLLSLPDETIIYPGHGPETTIGEERKSNPYLNGVL